MMPEELSSPVLVLVDDSAPFLNGILEMLEPKYEVAGAFSSGSSVLESVEDLMPDIIILDISLEDMSGFDVMRPLRSRRVPAKILLLTTHENADFVGEAYALGASGYVFKSRTVEDLPRAIEAIVHGGQFTSSTSQE
jgi:DNA-binding NarL/FixJ family response regulator